jgi:hypothetical protein
VESFDDLADEVAHLEHRVSRRHLRHRARAGPRGRVRQAKELERQLSKVRRSLQKAEMLLRGDD